LRTRLFDDQRAVRLSRYCLCQRGYRIIGSIEETSEAMFDEVLRTNLTGVFVTIKAALPLFRPGASIILNGSIAATTGTPAMGSYPASKAGLRAMSRSFAAELSSPEFGSISSCLGQSTLQYGSACPFHRRRSGTDSGRRC